MKAAESSFTRCLRQERTGGSQDPGDGTVKVHRRDSLERPPLRNGDPDSGLPSAINSSPIASAAPCSSRTMLVSDASRSATASDPISLSDLANPVSITNSRSHPISSGNGSARIRNHIGRARFGLGARLGLIGENVEEPIYPRSGRAPNPSNPSGQGSTPNGRFTKLRRTFSIRERSRPRKRSSTWTLFDVSYAQTSKNAVHKSPSEGHDHGSVGGSTNSGKPLTSSVKVEVVNTTEKDSSIVQFHSLDRTGAWVNH